MSGKGVSEFFIPSNVSKCKYGIKSPLENIGNHRNYLKMYKEGKSQISSVILLFHRLPGKSNIGKKNFKSTLGEPVRQYLPLLIKLKHLGDLQKLSCYISRGL